MRIRKIFKPGRIVALLLVIAALVVLRIRQKGLANAPRDTAGPLPVRAVTACRGDLHLNREYTAMVEARSTMQCSARVTAPILSVSVREGDSVRTGDLLVELRNTDWQVAFEAAGAQTAAAAAERTARQAAAEALELTCQHLEREWQRQKLLLRESAAAEQQEDAAREKLNDARGRLSSAKAHLDAADAALKAAQAREKDADFRLTRDARLLSEVDGVVLRRLVDPGDMATPGKTLLEIASRDKRVVFDIPQEDVPLMETGREIEWLDTTGKTGMVTVSRMHPLLDASRTMRVEAQAPGDAPCELPQPGSFLTARLQTGQLREVVLLPARAVIFDDTERSFVYVVEEGCLQARNVDILGRVGDVVAVNGIDDSATVVVNPFLGWAKLANGRPVEVLP